MRIIYFVLSGLIGGIIGGMGMGGGTLLIPIITIFLAVEQRNAQAVNLLVFIPMAIVALGIHIKNKLVDFKVGILIMCSGIIFSILGSFWANEINNNILRKIFAVFLLLVGVYQFICTIKSKKKIKDKANFKKYKIKILYK